MKPALLDCFKNMYNNILIDKSILISEEELKDIFLAGFARNIQFNIEQFFEFDVNISDKEDNDFEVIITAKLKNNFETECYLLKEFLLKENLEFTKQMFGVPEYFEEAKNMMGIIEDKK